MPNRRLVLMVVTLAVGMLVGPVTVRASNHLFTYRFEGEVSSTEGGSLVTGSVVFDPSVAPDDIRGPFDLGERVVYRGAADRIAFKVDGFTRQLTNGDIQVWNDYSGCVARTATECLEWQLEPDRLSFKFGPVAGEDSHLIAIDSTRQMLSSIVLPTEPPTGAERIVFDWETTTASISGDAIQWVYEREIDIRPDSESNPVNLKSKGIVSVAILGSSTFDVSSVDVTSLEFGPSGAAPLHSLHPMNVNSDGALDLVAHFSIPDTGIQAGDIEACLVGDIDIGGFIGCDSVITKP